MADEGLGGVPALLRGTVRASSDVAALAAEFRESFWDVSPNGEWRHPAVLMLEEPLPARTYEAIGELVAELPDLFVAVSRGADPSLSWLQYMPQLRGLHLGTVDAQSLEPLAYVPELRTLEVSGVHPAAPSLTALRHVPLLEELELDGQATDFDAVAELHHLRVLSLYRAPVRSLEVLGEVAELEFLRVSFGRVRDFSPLTRLRRLRGINFWQISSMTEEHLAPLGTLPALEAVSLGAVGKITTLRGLASAARLRYLTLEGLAGLSDLEVFAQFPALEEIGFWGRISDGGNFAALLSAAGLDALIVERNVAAQQADALWSQFRGGHLAVNGRVRSASQELRIGWRQDPIDMLHASTRRRQWIGAATPD